MKSVWLVTRNTRYGEYRFLIPYGGAGSGFSNGFVGQFRWDENPTDAFQFVRQQDADALIGCARAWGNELPHKETIAGLRQGDDRPYAKEFVVDAAGQLTEKV